MKRNAFRLICIFFWSLLSASPLFGQTTTTVRFSDTGTVVDESAGQVTVSLLLTQEGTPVDDTTSTITINYTVSGTAEGDSVDHDLTDGSLTVTSDETLAAITFRVVDDGVSEGSETVIITLDSVEIENEADNGNTVEIGSPDEHVVTIQDNDITLVSWSTAIQQVSENAGTVTLTATLNGISVDPVQVPYTVGGTAVAGADHDLTDGTIEIAAGETVGSVTFNIIDDEFRESTEVIVVTMGTPVNAARGTITIQTIAIDDNDIQATPSVSWTRAIQNVSEDIGTASLTASLSTIADVPVVVPYTVEGTAVPGEDHDLNAGEITIPAGSTIGTISFNINDDPFFEDDEIIVVTMGTPENATRGQITVHIVTIVNNDSEPVVEWESDRQTVSEDVRTVTLTAVINRVSNEPVVVPYTVEGTAVPGEDHELLDGAVTIPVGETSANVLFNLIDDAAREDSETIIVTLGTPVNATIGETTVTEITITDNDADEIAPTIQLIGNDPATVAFGEEFEDPGAVATDNLEGDISDRIVIDSNVNPRVEGTYRVTYNVIDESGNAATEAVRIVHVTRIVDLYQITSVEPVGFVVDQDNNPLAGVTVSSDVSPRIVKTGEDGFFTYPSLPRTGRVYFLTFSLDGYITTSRTFTGVESLGDVVLVDGGDTEGYDVISGVITSFEGVPVEDAGLQLNSSSFPALTFSDEDGQYTIAVDRRARPYNFTAFRYGFDSETFTLDSGFADLLDITLIEETNLIVTKPRTTEAFLAAFEANSVEIRISAVPPFTGRTHEFATDEPADVTFASEAYVITHFPYESFQLQVEADTTENEDVRTGYVLTRDLEFTAVAPDTLAVFTEDTLKVTPGYPQIMNSSDEDSPVWVALPASEGLQGKFIPDEVLISMTEYTDLASEVLVGKAIEVEITDESGKVLTGYPENRDAPVRELFVRLGYEEPVTRAGLEEGTDLIVYGESLAELEAGDGAVVPADQIVRIDSGTVTFYVDTVGAYGFEAASGPVIGQGLISGGAGGCFINTLTDEE